MAIYANTLRIFDSFFSALKTNTKLRYGYDSLRDKQRRRLAALSFEAWVVVSQSQKEFLRLHALHWRHRVPVLLAFTRLRRAECVRLSSTCHLGRYFRLWWSHHATIQSFREWRSYPHYKAWKSSLQLKFSVFMAMKKCRSKTCERLEIPEEQKVTVF